MAKTKKERMGDIRGRIQILAMGVATLPEKDSDVATVDLTLMDGTIETIPVSPTRSTIHWALRDIELQLRDWE
jgi:hypothetical protein